MKQITKLALLSVLPFVAACNPYDYQMNAGHIISCRVLTPLPTVEQGSLVTTLHDSGAINMSYYGATEYVVSMDMKLVKGSGFRVLIRPDVEQRNVLDSGIVVTVTPHGTTLDSAHHTFLERSDIRMAEGAQLPMSILSENNLMQVVLGCDTVYKGWTKKMESDDVVIESMPGSEVLVIRPDWNAPPGITW
jgi:hypothetical protein